MFRSSVITICLLGFGCATADILGVDEDGRFPGTLEHYGDSVRLEIPMSASVDEDVTIVVYTYGGGCISTGETETNVDGLSATVRPYDYVPLEALQGKLVCTLDLRLNKHEAILRFAERGTAWIEVHGRRMPDRSPVTVARSILIE